MGNNIFSGFSFEWISPERLKITKKLPRPRWNGKIKVKWVVTGFYKNELQRMKALEFLKELEERFK